MIRPDTFLDSLRACFCEFESREHLLPRIAFYQSADESHRREWLECHARRYVIDHMLQGLGWNIQACSNLEGQIENTITEVGVQSLQTQHRRFLDYLGCEHTNGKPLLLVEAKRPSLDLSMIEPGVTPSQHPLSAEMNRYLCDRGAQSRIILSSEWREHLESLRDYVRSAAAISQVPKRAIITNGEWLIIFLDPGETFNGSVQKGRIVVFQGREEILRNYDQVFNLLAYRELSADANLVAVEEISAYVQPSQVDNAIHGLRIAYSDAPGVYRKIPRINIAPIMVLFGRQIGRVIVESRNRADFDIPAGDGSDLEEHRRQVSAAAQDLKLAVEQGLGGIKLRIATLEEHFCDERAFSRQRAMTEELRTGYLDRRFVLLTGQQHHFCVDPSAYAKCPFHQFQKALDAGVQHEGEPVHEPMVSPKSFFSNGSRFYCAHRATQAAKETPVTSVNQALSGPRSGQHGEPFCEIWKLDQFLCCRTCVFQHVCTSSTLFQLPCPHAESEGIQP